jgi:hypothetical protein
MMILIIFLLTIFKISGLNIINYKNYNKIFGVQFLQGDHPSTMVDL